LPLCSFAANEFMPAWRGGLKAFTGVENLPQAMVDFPREVVNLSGVADWQRIFGLI
jgi:hypothetical protein